MVLDARAWYAAGLVIVVLVSVIAAVYVGVYLGRGSSEQEGTSEYREYQYSTREAFEEAYKLSKYTKLLKDMLSYSISSKGWFSLPIRDLPFGLRQVVYSIAKESKIDPSVLESVLKEQGFAIIESRVDDLIGAYKYLDYPKLVTVDSILYTYHVVFDNLLEDLEEKYFISYLKSHVMLMLEKEISEYNNLPQELRGTIVEDALLYNIAYYLVLARILEIEPATSPPQEAGELADKEIQLIESASSMDYSPLFGYLEDYTQYKPRGHYTRSEDLKKYFKAMMYMGRMMFNLYPRSGQSEELVNRLTVQAIILSWHINETRDEQGFSALDYWIKIYLPTVLIVGGSDDPSPMDYLGISLKVYGKESYNLLLDNNLLDEFKKHVVNYTLSTGLTKIVSAPVYPEEKPSLIGMRVMGQRFILDGYIHQLLCYDEVPDKTLVYGLEIPAAFGSDRAWELLEPVRERYGKPYEKQMMKAREIVENVSIDTWFSSLYNAWLYTLKTLVEPPPDYMPPNMKTTAYIDKNLNTFLASWAQLRHDTILYAKQPYAVLTALIEPRGIGWVEPMPKTYAVLYVLTEMSREGLKNMDLLDEVWEERLTKFSELLKNLYNISLKELSRTPISSEEADIIRYYHEQLEEIINGLEKDPRIIADVFTDPNTMQVLEVGTGYFNKMVMIYQEPDGSLGIAVGFTMSYYEFYNPINQRLTDEEWQDILEKEHISPPEWIQYLVLSK
ncbi:MAG: DUF3160 domain-containing protein [Desulfurococcales archaeon]|nr:DUF3160 domain-containing protein [Desulfurococcales archaeon]